MDFLCRQYEPEGKMNDVEEENGKIKRVEEIIDKQILDKREVFLWGGVDDSSAERIVKRLLYLDSVDHNDITLYINSPGGVISSGMAVLDTMNMIKSDVATLCLGQAASMGAVILALGKKGKRYILPNARVMIHQPLVSGQIFGPASDIQIQADEILRIRKKLNELFAEAASKKLDQIEQDTDRDFFMDAEEAISYGIVDKLWRSRVKKP